MKLAHRISLNFLRLKLTILSLVSRKRAAKEAFKIFCTPFRKSRKKRPAIFEQGESLTFLLDGLTLKGHRWNAQAGKKCLIVHGFESASYNFDGFIEPLISKNYEVIAFDAPAHGLSEGEQVNLFMYVKMITEIDEKFGPIDAYLAHSFGGLAVTHYLENVEDTRMIRLVLIAPATETLTAVHTFFKAFKINENLRPAFDEVIHEAGGLPLDHYSVRRAMASIRSETLWIHDVEDEMTPLSDAMKVRQDQHRHVRFKITKGYGHRKIYREPEVVKAILDFL